jgi:hypothetical protein
MRVVYADPFDLRFVAQAEDLGTAASPTAIEEYN